MFTVALGKKKNSNSYSTICICIDNFEPSISFNMGQRQADECLVEYMSSGGGGGHLFTPLYLAISINFILLKIMIDCARKLRLREKNRVKDERG